MSNLIEAVEAERLDTNHLHDTRGKREFNAAFNSGIETAISLIRQHESQGLDEEELEAWIKGEISNAMNNQRKGWIESVAGRILHRLRPSLRIPCPLPHAPAEADVVLEIMFSGGERHLPDHFPSEVRRAMEGALDALQDAGYVVVKRQGQPPTP